MVKDSHSECGKEDAELISVMCASTINERQGVVTGKLDDKLSGSEQLEGSSYAIIANPIAETVDLSKLRGVASCDDAMEAEQDMNTSETDLENLAELVPDVKARRRNTAEHKDSSERASEGAFRIEKSESEDVKIKVDADGGAEVQVQETPNPTKQNRKMSLMSADTTIGRRYSTESLQRSSPRASKNNILSTESMLVQESRDMEDKIYPTLNPYDLPEGVKMTQDDDNIGPMYDDTSFDGDYPGSDHVLEDQQEAKVPKEFMNIGSSAQSISTATQTHEVRMPMYLPTFKPATGCTNASDFIVRCFVARLRSGITVVKHGRARWCKSRLRVLHIHPDGRSLSWKPAEGEPNSPKRPPKLDLSTCVEVRHAWSPDPQNPMYTGTPILRQKCEAANAHKSFALIFKQRTVDITAVTADQCKVLMEGFSALCFRLQVANLAGRGGSKKGHARPMPEEDGMSTTASATLTNSSTPRAIR